MTVENLNDVAARLLRDGEVDVVVGYERGTRPLTASPKFAFTPEGAEALIFDETCEYNLTNYLHRLKDKTVGLVVKGCDERSVVGLLQEQQVRRDRLVLIGAPCRGVIDRQQVEQAVNSAAIEAAEIVGEKLTVTVQGQPHHLDLNDMIFAFCRDCPQHNPKHADVLIAEPLDLPDDDGIDERVTQAEDAPADERWEQFAHQMHKCILCFACRNVCPACYCNACFTEQSNPKWMSKTADDSDAMYFHLTRLQHLAGRCTGCGACVRACPVNVDLRLYNDKLRKDVQELFDGFQAGVDPDATPPLGCFCTEDLNDIFK